MEFKDNFQTFVQTTFADDQAKQNQILNSIDWEQWIYEGGANPKGFTDQGISFYTDSAKEFEDLADSYISLGNTPDNYDIYLTTDDPQLKVIFLNRLLARSAEVTTNLIAVIDKDYNCTIDANPEIG